MRGDI